MLELEVEPWSVVDAAELYEVARWGNGYFSVNDAGHVCVHPTKDPSRSIDLKQLVDRLQLRGIDLPILIRFAEILEAPAGRNPRRLSSRDRRAQVSGQLLLRLSDQGQPAAAGGRRGAAVRPAVQVRPGGGQQAGVAGRRGDGRQRHADHLQRFQGRRVHRDGDAGPQDRPADHPGRREIHRAGADPRLCREDRRAAA